MLWRDFDIFLCVDGQKRIAPQLANEYSIAAGMNDRHKVFAVNLDVIARDELSQMSRKTRRANLHIFQGLVIC